jgi:hypothetical protein
VEQTLSELKTVCRETHWLHNPTFHAHLSTSCVKQGFPVYTVLIAADQKCDHSRSYLGHPCQ